MALETPLSGRFLKEGRILFFGPPHWYFQLMWGTLAFGGLFILVGLVQQIKSSGSPFYYGWVGLMLIFAGLWAFGSLQRITFDLRAKTYRRWYGPGLLPRTDSGAIENLHSMVLMAEDRVLPTGRTAIYRLVLYWRNPSTPPMVVQQLSIPLPMNVPLNSGVRAIGTAGWEYAKALNIAWQDISHSHQPGPVSIFS